MGAYKGVVPAADYTFDKTAKTVTFSANYTGIALSDILQITNVKTGVAVAIYDPFDATKTGSLSSLVLTLDYDTSAMNNADTLMIIVGMQSLGDKPNLASDAATQTTLATRLSESDFDTKIGSLTETAPTTDTASSGLNGRLQRIAQRITSLLALIPSALSSLGNFKISFADVAGTAVDSNSGVKSAGTLRVVIATDQPQLTNKLLVTPDANSQVDINKVAGTTTDVNSGNKSAGSQRVVIATDDINLAAINAVSGTTSDAAVNTDTTGTISGKLRGIVKILAAGITATIGTQTKKMLYNSTSVMTVTNLQSLASSATAGWQSDKVSNLSSKAIDYGIFVKLTTANTAPANDKAMYVYVLPWYTSDGGTTWYCPSQGTTTLPTGTEGTTTIASPNNLRLLGVLNYTTTQMVVQDYFMLKNAFGDSMPDAFSIIIINFSGAALSTGCIVNNTPINTQMV